MYKIRKHTDNGLRSACHLVFASYDSARNYARKLLRKTAAYRTLGANWNNPSISEYGFTIVKV